MVKSKLDDGASVAPFLVKCYDMVDDPTTDDLISWCTDDGSFVISDVAEFVSNLLPKYFKHNNLSSFIRQLNIYGFKKTDTDKWIFANDWFVKGQKNLLKNIQRRKQSQAQSIVQQKENNDIAPCDEAKELNGLWNEVESLKADKNILMQELAKLRQHQENSHGRLVVLRKQIKDMDKDQQQMLSFIVMVMQNPGFLVHILQPKEPNWRRTDTSKDVFNRVVDDDLEENAPSSERMIVRYQPPVSQSPTQLSPKKFLGPDTSNGDLDFLSDIDFLSEPMDDLLSFENCGQLISDEHVDYSDVEQFLFSSPLREDKENANSDSGEWENSNMESLALGSELERDQKLEILTERMGNLASECNIKQ